MKYFILLLLILLVAAAVFERDYVAAILSGGALFSFCVVGVLGGFR